LLRRLIREFAVETSDVDEEALVLPDPWATAEGLAVAKARAVAARNPGALVIGGDTVVALPVNNIRAAPFIQLAKPDSREGAISMLSQLSEREHAVITGVALFSPVGERVFSDTTWVRFRALSSAEIAAYVDTGEPMDKAGAYAIQGGAARFVLGTEGSVSNVIGLPLEALEAELNAFNG
jgi:septum formation protein